VHVSAHRGPAAAHVVASERMDDAEGWRLLAPGELLVADGTGTTSLFPFDPPAHRISADDLSVTEATSQK
jgi:glutamine amidotransferase